MGPYARSCWAGTGVGKRWASLQKGSYKADTTISEVPCEAESKEEVSSFCPLLVLQSCINACHWPNCLKARGSQKSESEECHSLRNGAESKKAQDQQGPNRISCAMSSLVSPRCSLSVKLYPCGRHVLLPLFEV